MLSQSGCQAVLWNMERNTMEQWNRLNRVRVLELGTWNLEAAKESAKEIKQSS